MTKDYVYPNEYVFKSTETNERITIDLSHHAYSPNKNDFENKLHEQLQIIMNTQTPVEQYNREEVNRAINSALKKLIKMNKSRDKKLYDWLGGNIEEVKLITNVTVKQKSK